MVLTTLQKVWSSGSVLCIAIPKDIERIKGLSAEDRIQVEWGEVIKPDNFLKEEKVGKRGMKSKKTKIIESKKEKEDEVLPIEEETKEEVLPEI